MTQVNITYNHVALTGNIYFDTVKPVNPNPDHFQTELRVVQTVLGIFDFTALND